MTFLLELLRAASTAPAVLGETSTKLVGKFLLSQQNADGGFKDRTGKSDLYYSTFGLAGLFSLMAASDSIDYVDRKETSDAFARAREFLATFGDGEGLDFVHLCSLARMQGASAVLEALEQGSSRFDRGVMSKIEQFRAQNGGYNPIRGSALGTAYGAYLALSAYQDLGGSVPRAEQLADSLETLRTPDGAWTNQEGQTERPHGATNATAAAVGVLQQFGMAVPAAARDWLFGRIHPQGGFAATPTAPLPDLLSTASALHSLAGLGADLTPIRDKCLDFVDSLWTNAGGFHGHWGDDFLDVEYTFYGLLALGQLALYDT